MAIRKTNCNCLCLLYDLIPIAIEIIESGNLPKNKQPAFTSNLNEERLYTLLMQAPATIATHKGSSHIFEAANANYYNLINRGDEILGKTVIEALPEVADQGFINLPDNVYLSGEAYIGNEVPLALVENNSIHRI